MTEHFNSADKNLQTWVEKAKDPIDKLFREKEALAVLASKEDLKASEADFQKLLVTPEMLATKYGARAAIRRKLMEPVDALVDKAIEHIAAQLDEKFANETDDEKIEQLQLKADAIIEKIVRELDNPSILGEWDAGEDSVKPPPRGWLLGNMFARRFLSILVAEGGVGKSAVQYAQLLSLAIGRSLTGDYDGNRYSEAANAGGRAAWKIIQRHIPAHTEQQARDIIKAWVDDGTLRRDTYDNPVTRKKGVSGLWVNRSGCGRSRRLRMKNCRFKAPPW